MFKKYDHIKLKFFRNENAFLKQNTIDNNTANDGSTEIVH